MQLAYKECECTLYVNVSVYNNAVSCGYFLFCKTRILEELHPRLIISFRPLTFNLL